MGQGRSKQTAYVCPCTDARGHQPIRKTGSLNSINFSRVSPGRARRNSSLRHSRSFRHNKEMEEQMLRERIALEADELQQWVGERPKSSKGRRVPLLSEMAASAVASWLRAPLDVEGLPVARELKDAVEFRLSPTFDEALVEELAQERLHFSNGGRTIEYCGKGYSTIVMKTPWNKGLSEGRHAWIFYVDNSRVQGWIQIGVVDAERVSERCATHWDGNPHPFRRGEVARRSNGNFHSGESELEATMAYDDVYVGGYTSGDTIALKLDFDRRKIQWMKNGENYGGPVAFTADVLYPSVSLDSPGEAVSLVYYAGPLAL